MEASATSDDAPAARPKSGLLAKPFRRPIRTTRSKAAAKAALEAAPAAPASCQQGSSSSSTTTPLEAAPAAQRGPYVPIIRNAEDLGAAPFDEIIAEPQTTTTPASSAPSTTTPTLDEKGSRLTILSWNPGAGCRNLPPLIDSLGYHIVVCQEAPSIIDLPDTRWTQVSRCDQLICARTDARICSLGGERPAQACRWHFARIDFQSPRAGLTSMTLLSIHLNNVKAKKAQAPLNILEDVLTKAYGLAPIDLIMGDLNMARWEPGTKEWRQDVLTLFLKFDLRPLAEHPDECCFIGISKDLANKVRTSGNSWRSRPEHDDYANWPALAARFGCKASSHDVHWPMTAALKPLAASSGFRRRTPEVLAARQVKKQAKRAAKQAAR